MNDEDKVPMQAVSNRLVLVLEVTDAQAVGGKLDDEQLVPRCSPTVKQRTHSGAQA